MIERDTLLTALMFVFENFFEEEAQFPLAEEQITDRMLGAGFDKREIKQALTWFDHLGQIVKQIPNNPKLSKNSFRAFSNYEYARISREARSLLLQLEQSEIIDAVSREMIIDRALALNEPTIETVEIKWVALMVLYSQSNKSSQLTLLEDMVLYGDDDDNTQH